MTVKEVNEMLEQMMEKIGGRKVNVEVNGRMLYLCLDGMHVTYDDGIEDDDRPMIYIHNDDCSASAELHTQKEYDDEYSTIESIEMYDDGGCQIVFEDEDFGYITITPINE